jgi:hypothetical protein
MYISLVGFCANTALEMMNMKIPSNNLFIIYKCFGNEDKSTRLKQLTFYTKKALQCL